MSESAWIVTVVVVGVVGFAVGLLINMHDAEKSDKQIAEERVALLRSRVVVKLRELARRVENPDDDLLV